MKQVARCTALIGALIVLGTVTPSPALAAEPPSGRSFGQHVSSCAQTTGFDSEHNPGMHSGFAGWNGMAH
jgi:hypothetical protein